MNKNPFFSVKCIIIVFITFMATVSIVWRCYIKLTALTASDWSQFESDLITTFFGVGLGVYGGLWLNRQVEKERASQHEEARREKEKRILVTILDELNFNLDILEHYKDMFYRNDIQHDLDFKYALKTEIWDIVSSSNVLEVGDNIDLLNELTKVYNLQNSCNDWIKRWKDAKHSPSAYFPGRSISDGDASVGLVARNKMWKNLSECLRETYETITKRTKPILENELKSLVSYRSLSS